MSFGTDFIPDDMDDDDLPPPRAACAPPLPRADSKVPAKARFLLPRLHAANCQPGNTLYLQILGKWSHTMVVPPGYKPTRCDMRTRMQRPASLALLGESAAVLLAAVCSRASCPASLKRRWATRRCRPRCSARSRPPETAAARLSHPTRHGQVSMLHPLKSSPPAGPPQQPAVGCSVGLEAHGTDGRLWVCAGDSGGLFWFLPQPAPSTPAPARAPAPAQFSVAGAWVPSGPSGATEFSFVVPAGASAGQQVQIELGGRKFLAALPGLCAPGQTLKARAPPEPSAVGQVLGLGFGWGSRLGLGSGLALVRVRAYVAQSRAL